MNFRNESGKIPKLIMIRLKDMRAQLLRLYIVTNIIDLAPGGEKNDTRRL